MGRLLAERSRVDYPGVESMKNRKLRREIGSRIRQLRLDRSLLQSELCRRVGLTPSQLSKFESGYGSPTADGLVELSEALGTSVTYLLTGKGDGNPSECERQLMQRARLLEGLDPQLREALFMVLDGMLSFANLYLEGRKAPGARGIKPDPKTP